MPNLSEIWTSKIAVFKREVVLTLLCALLVIVVGVYWLTTFNTAKEQKNDYFSDVKNIPIKTYSLGGKVISANYPTVVLEVGQVVTRKNGNNLEYKQYTFQVNESTSIMKTAGKEKESQSSFSSIIEGADITVYTGQSPYDNEQFTPTKIVIN